MNQENNQQVKHFMRFMGQNTIYFLRSLDVSNEVVIIVLCSGINVNSDLAFNRKLWVFLFSSSLYK